MDFDNLFKQSNDLALDLIQVIDRPEDIVEAIFKHYESRGFAPLPSEREMLLNL